MEEGRGLYAELAALVHTAVDAAQRAQTMAAEVKAAQSAHERICEIRQQAVDAKFEGVLEQLRSLNSTAQWTFRTLIVLLLTVCGTLAMAILHRGGVL